MYKLIGSYPIPDGLTAIALSIVGNKKNKDAAITKKTAVVMVSPKSTLLLFRIGNPPKLSLLYNNRKNNTKQFCSKSLQNVVIFKN